MRLILVIVSLCPVGGLAMPTADAFGRKKGVALTLSVRDGGFKIPLLGRRGGP